MDRILGIDEAGRGSWLGPLVIGGFLVAADRVPLLRELGVKDSKALAPRRRETIYEKLAEVGTPLRVALAPDQIDPRVARNELNRLEAEAFASLVRAARPTETRVDACDVDARRFGRTVRRLSGREGPVRSRHKMDRDDPVVAAASIVAKVERDRALGDLARRLGEPIGSGYPSDPRTVRFVRARWALDPGSLAGVLRRSWAPSQRLILARPDRTLDDFAP